MQDINIAVALSAGVVILLGLVSALVKRTPLSVPMLALGAGVLAGPEVLRLLDPADWSEPAKILREAARITLAISVTGIALRTPMRDVARLLRPVALLLTLGMVAMWLAGAGLAWWLLGLGPLTALLLGAILAPTDPVVASSIVTGGRATRLLPDRLRSALSLESGANDGLAYLLVLLPLLLLTEGSTAETWGHWITDVLGVGILAAVAVGAVLGALVGLALRAADAAGLTEEQSLLSLSVALSLLALAGAHLIGSDGILAAFAAGLAFNATVSHAEDFEEQNVQEAISKLFNIPIFVLLGLYLPWQAWAQLGREGLIFAAAILLLRRPAGVLPVAPMRGPMMAGRDMVFLGWFGPIGVAALYYALLSVERTGDPALFHIASLVIVASILVHGATAAWGSWLYATREHRRI